MQKNPDEVDERNHWAGYWLIIVFGLGLVCGIERSLFGVMGETLTFNVRKDLIRGVMYK